MFWKFKVIKFYFLDFEILQQLVNVKKQEADQKIVTKKRIRKKCYKSLSKKYKNARRRKNKINSIRLIIIGSVNAGKIFLLTRYVTRKFKNISKSTSNATFIAKTKLVNNLKYEIKL